MVEYKIVPDGTSGFGAEITSAGRFQSVRGFPTEADALIWVAEQQEAAMERSPYSEGNNILQTRRV